MAQLRQDHLLFEAQDTLIVAVGPEDKETFVKFWEENQMPFVGIPDPEHRLADLYGQKVNLLKLGRLPAQMIIDKKGIVREIHYGDSMKDIPDNKAILEILRMLQNEV